MRLSSSKFGVSDIVSQQWDSNQDSAGSHREGRGESGGPQTPAANFQLQPERGQRGHTSPEQSSSILGAAAWRGGLSGGFLVLRATPLIQGDGS